MLLETKVDSVDAIFKSKKKLVHNGPLSQLEAIKDTLLCYIFKLREQGIIVNMFVVTLRASFLSPGFHEKSSQRTHTSQRPPAEVESEALDYAMQCAALSAIATGVSSST